MAWCRVSLRSCAAAPLLSIALVGIPQTTSEIATLGGIVKEAESGQPIAGALVTLRGPAVVSGLSDSEGRFRFDNVEPGRYAVSAAKTTWTIPRWSPRQVARAYVLKAGDRVLDAVTLLERGGALGGVVRDELGRPVGGARLVAAPCRGPNGGCSLAAPNSFAATTDVSGRYRIYGLPAASYVLAVTPRPYAESSAGSGPVFLPTYYPGVIDSRAAVPIAVDAGGDLSIDVLMRRGARVRIIGRVVGPTEPVEGNPSLILVDDQRSPISMPPTTLWLDNDGRFETPALPPGRYRLAAKKANQVASAVIDVAESDVTGIDLRLEPSRVVSGEIVLDSGVPSALVSTRLTLRRSDVALTMSSLDQGAAVIRGSAEFSIKGLFPGRYRLSAEVDSTGPGRLWAPAAELGGVDLFDMSVEVTDRADVTGVRVLVSPVTAGLTGALYRTDGNPAREYTVVLFPADTALWFTGSRRVRYAIPADDGSFEISGVPAGPYHVGAVGIADPDEIDWLVLSELLPVSVPVLLLNGTPTKVELRVGR